MASELDIVVIETGAALPATRRPSQAADCGRDS